MIFRMLFRSQNELVTCRSSQGFTLIEIMIAMAIVSLSFMGIMGMMCSGIYLFQMGNKVTTTSQVAQQVMSSIQQTPYAQLEQLQGQTYYFDDQGNQLSADNQSASMFQASLKITPITLPGYAVASTNLTTIFIQINYSPHAGNGNSSPGLLMGTYTITIANAN